MTSADASWQRTVGSSLGCLVGRELGYACPPVIRMERPRIEALEGGWVRVEAEGEATAEGELRFVGRP